MDHFAHSTNERSYCHVTHAHFLRGDQFLYLLDEGWQVISVGHEIYPNGTRRVPVIVFGVQRDEDIAEIAIINNPAIERFAQRMTGVLSRQQIIAQAAEPAATA